MPHTAEYYLERLAEGTITPEEWNALQTLLSAAENDAAFAEVLDRQLRQKAAAPGRYPQAVQHIQQGLAARIAAERSTTQVTPVKRLTPRRWMAAAAMVLAALAGTWLLLPRKATQPGQPVAARTPQLAPGINGALLTLADGKQVMLDTIKNGVVALQGGAEVRVVNGALVYENTGTGLAYNTISTPKGREYHIILPDGTGVWLNAASSIRYPIAFTAKERRIQITGEAYIQVAADARKPFYVATPLSQIQVLGTAFNINAYEDEGAEVTTLANGKIQVTGNTLANGNVLPVTLLPGQAAWCRQKELRVTEGDVEKALAWKNGIFSFQDADIPTVMRQLARWYNVEVKYEGQIPARTFEGEIGRTLRLDQVLRILTKTGIHYEIDGDIVTIQP